MDDVQERNLDEGASNPASTETIEEQANVKLVLEQLISLLEKEALNTFYDGNESLWIKLIELIGERLCRKPIYDDGVLILSKYKDSFFFKDLDILEGVETKFSSIFCVDHQN